MTNLAIKQKHLCRYNLSVCKITKRHVSCPHRDLPVVCKGSGSPDTIEATARSSRITRMTVFMMIVLLSGQQTECCSGSLLRNLYRELLGGRGGWKVRHFIVFVMNARLCNLNKNKAIKEFCSQGRNCRCSNILMYFHKCASDRRFFCVTVCAYSLLLNGIVV